MFHILKENNIYQLNMILY